MIAGRRGCPALDGFAILPGHHSGGPQLTNDSAKREQRYGPAEIANWLNRYPRQTQLILDLAAVVFAIGLFAQLGDPDVLLHAVWVILALGAFAFGLRPTLTRLTLATGALVVYFLIAGDSVDVEHRFVDLDPAEWPLMVVIAFIVAVMADRVKKTAAHYAELYRATSERLLTAQEDERRHLAQDLHDGVGQSLTALAFMLDSATSLVHPRSPARAVLARAREIAGSALQDTRDVALHLRPARLSEGGLVAAIGEMAARSGLPVELSIESSLVRPALLPDDAELEVYRIVQEAMANVARHAAATHVWLEVSVAGGALQIDVRDDGVGYDPSAITGNGLGLAGMRDRALIVGARLEITSSRGQGTFIRLRVPLVTQGANEVVLAPRQTFPETAP